MRYDDMVIISLNFKGLANNPKPRETFLWLKKNRFLYIICKKYIAQMRMNLTGPLDGNTPPVSPPFLVLEQASLYCLTTIFNLKL